MNKEKPKIFLSHAHDIGVAKRIWIDDLVKCAARKWIIRFGSGSFSGSSSDVSYVRAVRSTQSSLE